MVAASECNSLIHGTGYIPRFDFSLRSTNFILISPQTWQYAEEDFVLIVIQDPEAASS